MNKNELIIEILRDLNRRVESLEEDTEGRGGNGEWCSKWTKQLEEAVSLEEDEE